MGNEAWASKRPKFWGCIKPGLNSLLVPKAGSSLLAHCVYEKLMGKEFINKVDHLVHVRLMELTEEKKCNWMQEWKMMPDVHAKSFMVWRPPADRIVSAVRMFMDDTTDKEFKLKWWEKWIPFERPFTIRGMRIAISRGIDGSFHERHFQPYTRLLMASGRVPDVLVPLHLLERWLDVNEVKMPVVRKRNESSEYANSIDLTGIRDLLLDVERIDMSVWRKYCAGKGLTIYDGE